MDVVRVLWPPVPGPSCELLAWGQRWLLPWGTGLGCLLTAGGAWGSALGSLWWTVPLTAGRHSWGCTPHPTYPLLGGLLAVPWLVGGKVTGVSGGATWHLNGDPAHVSPLRVPSPSNSNSNSNSNNFIYPK